MTFTKSSAGFLAVLYASLSEVVYFRLPFGFHMPASAKSSSISVISVLISCMVFSLNMPCSCLKRRIVEGHCSFKPCTECGFSGKISPSSRTGWKLWLVGVLIPVYHGQDP